MKLLKLITIKTKISDKGLEKLESVGKEESVGELPKSWYTSQNLRPPKGAEDENEYDEDGNLILGEDDLEEYETEMILNLEDFQRAEDEEEITIIYTKDGAAIMVADDVLSIYAQIQELNMSIFRKLINKFKRTNKQKL